ncbi:head GIN domain-containing protein [Chitinophaga filiformis]|uniref:Putative auto-transporter adhesin, head GIN domain n=1 Tax=Chitinophaga filiformis TaxID=104663 RepID=A0A1G7U8X8_CHIFI|nr:head GIN domain-containing protein [Chitinophaga filiformis]SDG43489.1 Putative auto-transporter adhesin, head GIN domain [Chitinophaga filiformis]
MKKTNNRKSLLYNRWKTIGWELLLLAVFNIMLASCDKERLSGSGYVVSETRETGVFTDVEVDGPMHVHLQQGSPAPVQITAEDNLMRVIDTYVSGTTLHVRIKSGVSLHNTRDIDIYLKSATYNSVFFSGSGSVESLDTIRTDRFEYRLDGSGNARFPIITNRLETEINGSGDIQLNGSANIFHSNIDGSGDVRGMDFYCEDADISVKGSGGHTLNVSHSLDVSIRGSGEVRYRGAAVVRTDIAGSGKVIKL